MKSSLAALAAIWPYVAPFLTGIAGLYAGHRLQLRREKRSERRTSGRDADNRLRAALEAWVADCLALKEVSSGTLTEPGLDPPTDAAARHYEGGRAAVRMEAGGETFDKLFRKVVRATHLLRAETHEIFLLIADDDHLAGGPVARYWQEKKDRHHQAERRRQTELHEAIAAFTKAVEDRFGM